MRLFSAVFVLFLTSGTARAEDVIARLEWSKVELPDETTVREGALRVESSSTSTTGARIEIWSVTNPPGLKSGRWAIRGKVAGRRVTGDAYLELWSTIAKGRFFSRTVADEGPMAKLRGTFAARDFLLPFDAMNEEAPHKLELAVVLPGQGAIEVGPLELVAYSSAAELQRAINGDDVAIQAARFGWIGALYGSLVGLLGMLSGVLASFGRFYKIVLALLSAGTIASAAMAAWGAVLLSQGRNFPLTLIVVAAAMALLFAIIGQVVQKRRRA